MDNKILAKQQNRWKLQLQINVVMMNTSTEVANFHLNYHLRFSPCALTRYWKNTAIQQALFWKMLITYQS